MAMSSGTKATQPNKPQLNGGNEVIRSNPDRAARMSRNHLVRYNDRTIR